jgi:D-arabinose 1-dehydrogenase-like Zn-dependent alcohol dehydrogenase
MMGNKGSIVVDIDPVKRDAAMKAGALAVVDGKAPDAAAQIIKLTNGGAWAVNDYVGSSKTVQLGVDCITKGGKIIVVGLFGGDITVSTPFFPLKAMAIQGSYVGSLPEMKELLDLVRAKGLPPIPMTTRPLDQVASALDDLRAGKVIGRVVLTTA